MKRVRLITDGACLGNPGPGGWAAILRHNEHKKEIWGYLIEGHGLYAWGRDMAEARRHLDAFEFLINCELEMRKLHR